MQNNTALLAASGWPLCKQGSSALASEVFSRQTWPEDSRAAFSTYPCHRSNRAGINAVGLSNDSHTAFSPAGQGRTSA